MHTYISMLRGINVSGQKRITMVELKKVYEVLDLLNVETYVQSGNVVFNTTEQDMAKLSILIEKQIEETYGYFVPTLIRNVNDFQRIINNNPFINKRNEDPTKLYVTFLYRTPTASRLSALVIPNNEAAEFVLGEKEIYIFCPNGYGRTKLSNTFFEKKLDMLATTRNWNTVNALLRLTNERKTL